MGQEKNSKLMKILIISEDPETNLFHQIERLASDLKATRQATVDLFIFHDSAAQIMGDGVKTTIQPPHLSDSLIELANRHYYLAAISLVSKNAERLFYDLDFFNAIALHSPETILSVFTASGMGRRISSKAESMGIRIYTYSRVGLSRITKEWKTHLLTV